LFPEKGAAAQLSHPDGASGPSASVVVHPSAAPGVAAGAATDHICGKGRSVADETRAAPTLIVRCSACGDPDADEDLVHREIGSHRFVASFLLEAHKGVVRGLL